MKTDQDNWFIVRNPIAGQGKGEKDWPQISEMLTRYGFKFEDAVSQKHKHAIELSKSAYQAGFRKFIAMGGDGSINEVVNGILADDPNHASDATLAVIPIGKGNDWVRTMQIKGDYEQIIKTIKMGNSIWQDVGKIKYTTADGKMEDRYFISMATTGFGGFVGKRVNELAQQGKKVTQMSYFMQILKCLGKYDNIETEIKLNGTTLHENLFVMAVGICKSNGGGMKLTPDAIPDDHQFHVTLVHDASKGMVLRNLINLFNGKFVNHPKVKTFTTEQIEINGPETLIESDGESLGFAPAVFSVIPQKLKVITGEHFLPFGGI
jgi:YegS/Rv2252/BmrU family lipid kinase